jgi:predicted transcriptional regulator
MRISQAVTKVRNAFVNTNNALTITDIKLIIPELKSSQISMSLCYLYKARWVTREKVKSNLKRGHSMVWLYTYYADRLPKNAINTQPQDL